MAQLGTFTAQGYSYAQGGKVEWSFERPPTTLSTSPQ